MKKLKKLLPALFATITLLAGNSLVFADDAEDEAKYKSLLEQAKAYEEKSQWVHAMGTYYDAIATAPLIAEEAAQGFERIRAGFSGANPGPGEYDDFSRYDGWIEVCKEFEIYWNEHADEIVYISNVTAEKGDLDMATRTATYNFTAKEYTTPKFDSIWEIISTGFFKAKHDPSDKYNPNKFRTDWVDIPDAWPSVSMFKDSKTIPVVKLSVYHKNIVNKIVNVNETVRKNMGMYSFTGTAQYVYFPSEKTTDYYIAAWNNYATISKIDSVYTSSISHLPTNCELKIKITDETGRVIASNEKAASIDGYGDAVFTMSGISASDIKIMDSNKWNWEVESFVLRPKSVTATLQNDYFNDVKYNTNYSAINLYKKGTKSDALYVYNRLSYIQELYSAGGIKSEGYITPYSTGKGQYIYQYDSDSSQPKVNLNENEIFVIGCNFQDKNNISFSYRDNNANTQGFAIYDILNIMHDLYDEEFKFGEFNLGRGGIRYNCIYRTVTAEEKAQIEEQKAAAEKAKAEAEAKEKADLLAKLSPEPENYASILEDINGYKVAKYPVTQYLFEKLMGYNPSETKEVTEPVTNVSYYEIMVFCNRLSIAAGLTPVYIIKKSTNPDDWGAIPTASDKNWNKYKIDEKANGYCLPYVRFDNQQKQFFYYTDSEGKIVNVMADYRNNKDSRLFEKEYSCTFYVQQHKVLSAKDKLKAWWDSY